MQKYDSERDVVLVGGGGHCKVLIDTLLMCGGELRPVGITENDKNRIGEDSFGVKIIGTDDMLGQLFNEGIRKAFVGIGAVKDCIPRYRIYKLLEDTGFEIINIIHKSSIISRYACLGKGNAVLAASVINCGASIGNNCIINTGSIVEHDCIIHDNVHIATGAKLAGGVTVEENCMVGAGSVIKQGVRIGKNCIIGAGSVVIKDVKPYSTVVGVPAKDIKEGK